ncbi:response regulator transcription factor [Neoroseomonas lacus]|uniref:DNA-binding response regulator n=1 Tax=Neoroseomonas lacus TaxID=287609 RepID=A0A917NPP6_9PROT|nr:response regulator transcription factor [Neoroseomonas lacus]GGJ17206.1 DNA-binding response regulator [Neoroseomonas lacus]
MIKSGPGGAPAQKPPAEEIVIIVDDDASVRASLDSLLRSVGFATRQHASPVELLGTPVPDIPGCIVLDVRLPGISGLDLQGELARIGVAMPIVFMTGYGDVPMSVRAMKAGAVDFLPKPFRDQDMLDAVAAAVGRDRQRRKTTEAAIDLRERYETLSPREREVMVHVVAGLMNKQVAGRIGLSEITVKIHRGNAMRKMQAKSLAELVRQAEALGLPRP